MILVAETTSASLALSCGLLLLAIALSAFYSGSETGAYAVNRLRLELRCETDGDSAAHLLKRLLDRREHLLCVLLIGNNIANEAAAIIAEHVMAHWLSAGGAAGLATLVLTPLMFVLGEALPKQLFRQHAERFTYRVAPFLRLSGLAFLPLTFFVLPAARAARRWASQRRGSEMRGLRHDEYALERLLLAGESAIESVREVALGIGSSVGAPVRTSMIPAGRMAWLPSDATRADLLEKLRETPHARYPLRDPDGAFRRYVYFLDPFLNGAESEPLRSFARCVVQLDPSVALEDALASLEDANSRIGVVRARSGETLGFVMAGDVVGELLSMDNAPPAHRSRHDR